MADQGLPVVAVVGRPNVGKSSLVNRILGRREAIVEERPGVTRDRRSFEAEWLGRRFELIDTGGLEPGAEGLDARIAEQAHLAMETADVVVLVVDATTGPITDDLEVAAMLRRSERPVLVAVNKVDHRRDEVAAADFYGLGLGEPRPISALHGTGSGDLLDAIAKLLPDEGGAGPDRWADFALVGRPNVGKSSLLNKLVGEERSIVHDTPGTTRDPVDAYVTDDEGRTLRIVDTAGMRRRVQIQDPVEYFSFLRARGTLERVDAAVLVVDSSEGMTAPDQKIAAAIAEAGKACVVILNKWDLVTKDETDRTRFDRTIRDDLRFLTWAPAVRTSALTGRGIDKILPAVGAAVSAHRRRVPTSQVNRTIQEAQAAKPHPRTRGRAVRVLYAVQAATAPPTFLLFANGPLEQTYLRYLEGRVREVEPFHGAPLRLIVRVRTRAEPKVEG